MYNQVLSLSRYALVILFAYYTYSCFAALRRHIDEERQEFLFFRQTACMYLFLLLANGILFLTTFDIGIVRLLMMELCFFIATGLIYKFIYQNASVSVTNNMCMLLAISFVILTRLDIDKARRQFVIACAALAVSCLVPLIIKRLPFLNRMTWGYAAIGLTGLALVCFGGAETYGARLSLSIGGVAFQPSEFVKIVFVFFVASALEHAKDRRQLLMATVIAGLHILLLVASRDLGGAGILSITYLVMLYVASGRAAYLTLGGVLVSAALFLSYHLFAHVRVRVSAWMDPLKDIDGAGYQISHSLFAIGTGGWFGMGLYRGMPERRPVVEKDFIFSAVSEELGAVFALCLIFICISCFLLFFNISMQISDRFYKLVALGLGTVYATQTFLMIGGVIRFIPSTGVTLPLVSYGGSSLMSTMVLFAIIQGMYLMREGAALERRI